MGNTIDEYVKTILSSYTVIVVVALLIGATIGPAFIAGVSPGDTGTVAVVTIEEPITGSASDDVVRELRSVRENDSVDAVVLRIDSGGGAVSASEAQYRAVSRLAREKPVVTSVRGIAASGAYYTALPSEEIYTTPGGVVGSVGVRALVPRQEGVPRPITTGPDKAGGPRSDDVRTQVETLKRSFVQTVYAERGSDLELDRSELTNAKVYSGAAAVDNGLADEIGGLDTAIAAAAAEAGLDEYSVEYRSTTPDLFELLRGTEANATASNRLDARAVFLTPGIERPRYLMLWGELDTDTEYAEVNGNGSA